MAETVEKQPTETKTSKKTVTLLNVKKIKTQNLMKKHLLFLIEIT